MPWLALPYVERIKQGKLSRMYGVDGIPRLVMIDPKTGQAMNLDAKDDVLNDETLENFPWTKPTILDSVGDATVIRKTGVKVALSHMSERFLMLYFHASWCDACVRLLPTTNEWYKKFRPKLQDTNRSFEVVLITLDTNHREYEKSCNGILWPAMSFKDMDKMKRLYKKLGQGSIPNIIVIDKRTGKVVPNNARIRITRENSRETDFPWLISNLNEDASFLDRYPCIVLWLEEKTEDEKREYINMLNETAYEHLALTGYMDFGFLYATNLGNASKSLRAKIGQ